MPADRLRPQAEGAARFAAATRVERDIRVLEIATEIILDVEIALVHGRHERELIHVLENRPLGIVHDDAVGVAVGEAGDLAEVSSLGDLLDGVVELVPRHEVDRWRGFETLLGLDCHLGADEADLEIRIERLHRLCRLHIAQEGWRGGVQHEELVLPCIGGDIGEAQPMRRSVDQFRVRNEGGRLREPGRVPERAHLAPHLIACAGAAVETVIGRSLQEERSHCRPVPSARRQGSIGAKLVPMAAPHQWPRQEARHEDGEAQEVAKWAEPNCAAPPTLTAEPTCLYRYNRP